MGVRTLRERHRSRDAVAAGHPRRHDGRDGGEQRRRVDAAMTDHTSGHRRRRGVEPVRDLRRAGVRRDGQREPDDARDRR